MLLITFRVCGTFLVPSRIYNSFDVLLKTFSQKKITKNPENPENHYGCYKNWLFCSIWDW